MALASRSRTASLFFAAAALSSSLACSVILNPDDSVQRCGSADDCDNPEDERFEAVCVADPDADIDTTQVEQVCVAQFKTVGCNPTNYDIQNEFRLLAESRSFSDYSCADTPGVQGCPPVSGEGCNAGLEINAAGQCDVPGAEVPAINHNAAGLEAQDVRDQFCRGFFCDDSYVCNSESNVCQACDPELPYGQGGCGTVYTQGQPSCVYSDECAAPDSDTQAPIFGNCG